MKRHLLLAMAIGLLGCAGVGVGDPNDQPDLAVPVSGEVDLAQGSSSPDLTTPSMDDLIRLTEACPDVITIDVEGAELEVLKGAVFTLKHTRPTVFVSVHERFMAHHFGQRHADLYALFDRYDYRLFHLGSDHEQHIMAVPK